MPVAQKTVKKTKEVISYYNPKVWKEKGLKWTLGLFSVTAVLAVFVLMFIWSSEPSQFDVLENTYEITGTEKGQKIVNGAVTTATLSRLVGTLLDKPGGFIENDKLPPGVIMDNMPNWEFGVLTQIRDFSLSMRDDLSRSQSQSSENKNLVKAQISFNIDSESWMLPPAESSYQTGRKKVDAYIDELQKGQAQFFARADNLRTLLNKMQKRLGSLSQNLSASVGQIRINTDLAGDSSATQSSATADQQLIKTDWFKIDDVFYEARGQAWAMLHILKAVEIDFESVLKKKNALTSLRQIIRELESTQATVWSPVILNGSGFGFVTNHSLVMASYISRANAALIDLKNLLQDG
ncbi:MAG TPA: DUF2333 family protein [Leucothrix mucor]|uniref:DUF2333 family protein n=1 Tax=Leucothrix mucor TaxID=45248 RepID=A0A7V2T1V7_LEUMU|nr:DUF2333 family protein [Leucothrix mucor]